MRKSAFRKIKTLFGNKKEKKEHEAKEGEEKYSFAEQEKKLKW